MVVAEAMIEALRQHHACVFDEESRSVLRDVVAVGKGLKKAVVYGVFTILVFGLGFIFYQINRDNRVVAVSTISSHK